MKITSLLFTKKNSSQRMTMSLGFALTMIFLHANANPI